MATKDDPESDYSIQVLNQIVLYQSSINASINKILRPRLSRSCRCMEIQGHGYESVVNCVSILHMFGIFVNNECN